MKRCYTWLKERIVYAGNKDGFTLIELLIVVAIIAIMGTLAVGLYRGILSDTNRTAAKTDLHTFSQQLEIYNTLYQRYPATEEGLEKLIETGLLDKKKSTLLDPWNNPYHYRYPGQYSGEPEIWSYGADGVEGGEGANADINSWEQ